MKPNYIQDPNDPTKVIDTNFTPPSISPKDLETQLEILKLQCIIPQQQLDEANSKILDIQTQLDAIYQQVPEVQVSLSAASLTQKL